MFLKTECSQQEIKAYFIVDFPLQRIWISYHKLILPSKKIKYYLLPCELSSKHLNNTDLNIHGCSFLLREADGPCLLKAWGIDAGEPHGLF